MEPCARRTSGGEPGALMQLHGLFTETTYPGRGISGIPHARGQKKEREAESAASQSDAAMGGVPAPAAKTLNDSAHDGLVMRDKCRLRQTRPNRQVASTNVFRLGISPTTFRIDGGQMSRVDCRSQRGWRRVVLEQRVRQTNQGHG